MNVPVLSQHDPRWAHQRLGTVTSTTIGSHGCLITCITMANQGFGGSEGMPNNVDDLFTAHGGYANGNLVIWGQIQRLLANVGHVRAVATPTTPANVAELNAWLDQSNLAILEVRWHGQPSLMHFVLAVGHNGNDVIVNDPETGRQVPFSSKLFGTGSAAVDIITIHYLTDAIVPVNNPTPPQAPPAAPGEGRGGGVPQEEEVTQADHDAAVKTLTEAFTQQINDLKDKLQLALGQSTKLSDELKKYKTLDFESTYTEDRRDRVTTAQVLAIDFSGRKMVVLLEPNVLVEQAGTFQFDGETFARTLLSVTNGDWYGIDVRYLSDGQPLLHASGTLTDISRPDQMPPYSLSTSQQAHATIAEGVGVTRSWLKNLKLFGGKK
jgi:hypothetical protein